MKNILPVRLSTVCKLAALISLSAFAFSCQKSEINDLKEAQICLNESTPDTARSCLDKVGSNDSAQANKIKCAALFIAEGYNTPASFISALDQLNQPSGGCGTTCSSTVAAVSSLTFKNTDNTNATERTRTDALADEVLGYCTKSKTGIYMQIASLFNIGTKAANIAYGINGGTQPTPDQIQSAITTIPPEEMGNLAIATYNASCTNLENASESTKQYCAELGKAVNSGGTTSQVGDCLKNIIADPNYVCPQY